MIKISAPSKTYLMGEYLGLVGGPVLILNTEPRFECLVKSAEGEGESFLIHKESPAGKFLDYYKSDFEKYNLQFFDPYYGMGGFGLSSAQFIMVYALRELINHPSPAACSVDLSHKGRGENPCLSASEIDTFLNIYQELAWNGVGLAPSGADCISQIHGNICYYHKNTQKINTLEWPFLEIDFCLLHTGHKINTHQHLQEISLDIIPAHELGKLVLAGYSALSSQDSDSLIRIITEYSALQKSAGLLAMTSQDLLNIIKKSKGVLAAKGCGALGSDVILVLLERSRSLNFASSMQRQGLRVMYVGNKTSGGLQHDMAS